MKYLLPLLCCAAVFFGGRQFRIMRASAAASPDSPEAVAMATKERGDLRGLARQTQRLAGQQCDSPAALERLYRSGKLADDEFQQALAQAAEKDPAGTWEWLENQGFDRYRHPLEANRRIIFEAWFKQDPAAALARLETLPAFEAGQLIAKVLGKFANGGPAEVAAVGKHLDQVMDLLGGQLGEIYFPKLNAEGAAALQALPEGPARDRFLRSFVVSWMMKEPAAAAAFLKGQTPELRQLSMEELAKRAFLSGYTLTPEVKQLATDWLLKEAPPGIRLQIGPRLAAEMAKEDPAGALKWAAEHLDGKPLDEATGSIVGRMFAKDPASARALVESLPAGKRRITAAAKVTQQWVATEPEAAITWWLANSEGGAGRDFDGQSAASTIASTWLNKNPESFRAWLANPDAPQLPVQFLYTNMRILLKDREAGLDWIGTLPPASRTAVIRVAYDHLTTEAPADAAATFDSRPDLATGDAARVIASRWYSQNPQKAIDWAANLPWGGTREAALAGLKKAAERGGSIPAELQELLR